MLPKRDKRKGDIDIDTGYIVFHKNIECYIALHILPG